MPTSNGACAGCNNKITNRLFMSCCLCKLKYDIGCLNISEKLFQLMDRDRKATWTCQACKNRQPRSDNQNTPIRGAMETVLTGTEEQRKSPEHYNVTLRNKPVQSTSHKVTSSSPVTIEDISELIDRKLSPTSTIICNLRAALREDIKVMITAELNKAISQLKLDFTATTDFLAAEQVDLRTSLDKKNKEIDELQNSKLQLQTEIANLSNRLSVLEKISRDKNIEIHGLQENRNENLKHLFNNLCNTINISVPEDDIQTCRRVAKSDKTSLRPRNVLITLSSPRIRDYILAEVTKFNKSHKEKLNTSHFGIEGMKNKVYVSEHMSLECKKLYKEARMFGKEKQFKFVWVKRGNIFIKKKDDSTAILIRNRNCLETLTQGCQPD